MAKKQYVSVGGVSRECKKWHIGVDGAARQCKKGYVGVEGVARKFMEATVPVEDVDIGASVYLNVDGVPREFLVVNKGVPTDAASYQYNNCDGIWLLMKDIYCLHEWHSSDFYSEDGLDIIDADIRDYLNNDIYSLFDGDIQGAILETGRAYETRTGVSGIDGLKINVNKVFLLSCHELGIGPSSGAGTLYAPINEGGVLEYFSPYASAYEGTEDEFTDEKWRKTIAYYEGEAAPWWTASVTADSPNSGTTSGEKAIYFKVDGTTSYDSFTKKYGIRPAIILPYSTLVNC